MSDWQIPCCVF